MLRYLIVACCTSLVCLGCEGSQPQALGTLEWDRVNGRAVASEVITAIFVERGDYVKQGASLLQLDDRKVVAEIKELKAQHTQAAWKLKEYEAGPRQEAIAEARARVQAARATLANSSEMYERRKILYRSSYTTEEQLDIAEKNYLSAKYRLVEQSEVLNELLAGTRVEQLEQSRARVSELKARLEHLSLLHQEYTVTASRAGRVDSLPFKLGDRPPLQAVVSTLLTGNSPWARIYVPQPYRSTMQPGRTYLLEIDGYSQSFKTILRSISSDASFTPYFALTEKDRSRLSYVAELDLIDPQAKNLTSGTPVQLLLEEK